MRVSLGSRSYELGGDLSDPKAIIIGLTFSGHDGVWLESVSWKTGNPTTAGWFQHALDNNYAVAFPNPVAGLNIVTGQQTIGWNIGKGDNDPNPLGWVGSGANDAQFILDVVADVQGRTWMGGPIYIAGGSAGGGMAWRMICDHPELFGAVAMAAGWAPYRYPTHPIDARFDHATADISVPIKGGKGAEGYIFPALYDAMVKAPRGSRTALWAMNGTGTPGNGHGIPGWWAGQLWKFFDEQR